MGKTGAPKEISNGHETIKSMQKKKAGAGWREHAARRVRDFVLSLAGLVFLSPLMAAVALVIWVDSPGAGPVFVQRRVGLHGKTFSLLKFRTMCAGAEEELAGLLDQNEMNGPVFKMRHDPRITRVGRFLRRSGLDELPQLINVLAGDMSLVGPRPALPREVERYGPYERQRLCVLPGITCYWQIQPNRNEMAFQDWMELDMRYIRERSLRVDWGILLRTFGAVLRMQGM